VTLGACELGRDVAVLTVDLPQEYRSRMHEFGLFAGAVVHVTHRGPSGGRVVAVGGARLALDAATVARIEVEQL
jgi:ferrous iron transport protein A